MFVSFDIFRLEADGEAVWVKSVSALQVACTQVEQLSASHAGDYVLFGQQADRRISVRVIERRLSETHGK